MSIEAMKQALEALTGNVVWFSTDTIIGRSLKEKTDKAITSLRQAIEKAEKKEPKKWVEVECPLCGEMAVAHTHPVLTTPQPQREWVGLTEDEIIQQVGDSQTLRDLIRTIDHLLKEKNT